MNGRNSPFDAENQITFQQVVHIICTVLIPANSFTFETKKTELCL